MPADQNHAFDDGNRANFDAKSSQAKATESLPDFDKLPHIEEQQNRSQNFGNQNSVSHSAAGMTDRSPNDYQTFHFSMN